MHRKVKRKNTNKAFTLVELVIVVAILAILVGILAPQYTKYVEKSRRAADVSNLQEMVKAFQIAYLENSYEISKDGSIWICIRNTAKDKQEFSSVDLQGVDSEVKAAVKADMEEILGGQWKYTKLKSNVWDKFGTQIGVVLKVSNGSLYVSEYIPESLREFL